MSGRNAAAHLCELAGGSIEVAIILGSGLSEPVQAHFAGSALPYRRLRGAPTSQVAGHPGHAIVGSWGGKRAVAFAGRVHLYQGYSAREVTYFVRVAAKAGARTIVLTNAAGGLNPIYGSGDIMLIADHLNLTGQSPLRSARGTNPFVSMIDAYEPSLRTLARSVADGTVLREGVYAAVAGPAYETPAEAAMLRGMGADAVGMSTALETIAARALGLRVLGMSLITNTIGPATAVSHADVLSASAAAGPTVAGLLQRIIAALPTERNMP